MKYFVGIGGIGCRVLFDYMNNHKELDEKQFFYVDSDEATGRLCQGKAYIIPNTFHGTGALRNIGRNLVKYELFAGDLPSYFNSVRNADSVKLIFIVSSFGGFGGAAASHLIDYLEAVSWEKLENHCEIFAFNENVFASYGFPKSVLQIFEANTIEFLNELSTREESSSDRVMIQKDLFNPGCRLHMINTAGMEPVDFRKVIDASEEQLKMLDCKDLYTVNVPKKTPEVFISYSSKDQDIADMVADCLQKNGITPWIATRNICDGSYAKQIVQGIRGAKVFLILLSRNSIASEQVKNEIDRAFSRISDGITIIPFILDDSKLDDECQYYLCRQEMFYGTNPPLIERVEELVKKIKCIL